MQPRDLTDPALQASLTDEQIATTVRHGKGQMPGFGMLLDASTIDSLVRYVRTLEKKP